MTSLYAGSIVYISVADVRDTTTNTDILALSDPEIEELIYQSQIMVDLYINRTRGEVWECGQDFIFPIRGTDCNGYDEQFIPREVILATFYTLEYIFTSGYDLSGGVGDIKREKTGPHEVEYTDGTSNAEDYLSLPRIAKALLNRRRNTFYHPTL